MWPEQQPPGGEQNPYQQPGYQQPTPYGQQPRWEIPQPPQPGGPGGGGGGSRTKITAIVAALAVVVAAGVTGFLVLGGDKDDTADEGGDPTPTATTPAPTSAGPDTGDDPRGGDGAKATVDGWKVVVNPKWGTAFDVPADWQVESPGVFIGFEDEKKGDGSALIGMSAPAYVQEKWCTSDSDKDGTTGDKALGTAGTKGQNGAKNTADVARNDSAWWVFGGYTDQKDASKKLLTIGKATTFAFKNSAGDFVSWTFHGVKGTADEVPDTTVQKILSTVRLYGEPTD
ncbi:MULTISPECIES: hypothetical protein [unclassified Streptomyces]|uniref:hypothetical protein n=1 Tax=unclassified Streptomyces TaxID=2593676 RepID=UPI0036EF6E1A